MFGDFAESSDMISLALAASSGFIMSKLIASCPRASECVALLEVFVAIASIILLSIGWEEQVTSLVRSGWKLAVDYQGTLLAMTVGAGAGVLSGKRIGPARAMREGHPCANDSSSARRVS